MIISDMLKRFSCLSRQNRLTLILLPVALAYTIIVVGFYAYEFFAFPVELSAKTDAWAHFGDYLGGTLNPFFSVGALLFLALTYFSQQEELEATLRRSQEQGEAQRLSAIHETFFDMLARLDAALENVGDLTRDDWDEKKRRLGSSRFRRDSLNYRRIRQELITIAVYLEVSHLLKTQRADFYFCVGAVLNTSRRRYLAQRSLLDTDGKPFSDKATDLLHRVNEVSEEMWR